MLLTRSPLIHPNKAGASSFDLHVLSTPPAFVLSQDQTLRTKTIQKKPTTPQHHTTAWPANPNKKTNSKTKNRHKNKHTIEFTNNTHTPQNSHKKPQPSKKGRKQPRHNHKPTTTNSLKGLQPPGATTKTIPTPHQTVKSTQTSPPTPHTPLKPHHFAKNRS